MEHNPSRRVEKLSVAALFAVTLIWGAGFVFSRATLDAGLSPAASVFGRLAIAAVVTGALFHKKIRREYVKGQWKSGFVLGAIMFAAFFVQTAALRHTSPANNAFITSLYVVLVPLLWWAVTRKRPPAIMFAACALSFAGAAVLAVDPALGLAIGLGDGLTFLCALLFAAQIVVTGLLARTIQPTVLVFMQFAFSAALALVLFLFTDRNLAPAARWDVGLGLFYLGAVSTCLCYFFQTMAQKHLSSAKVGIILATESVFGALASVIFGYDSLSPRMVLGGLVMFASVLLPELWAARRQNRNSQPANKAGGKTADAPGENKN